MAQATGIWKHVSTLELLGLGDLEAREAPGAKIRGTHSPLGPIELFLIMAENMN